jgi:hypothetical protein
LAVVQHSPITFDQLSKPPDLWVPKTCATWAGALGIAVGSVKWLGVGRSWLGRRLDDHRPMGLKLIFLVVTRAVPCWACRGGRRSGRTPRS